MMRKKRAVSVLVATILLLLIVVVASGIVWYAVIPLIQKGISETPACITARLKINTESGFTCFNETARQLSIMISRGAEDFQLSAVQVIISSLGSSQKSEITENLPDINEDITYLISFPVATADAVGIAPIIRIGNTRKVCDITSTEKLDKCV